MEHRVDRIERALIKSRTERGGALGGRRASDETTAAAAMVATLAPVAKPAGLTRRVPVDAAATRRAGLLAADLAGPAGHSLRMLRAMVMQRMRANGWNTLAVVSPARDEGKTFVATNLAIALAAEPDQTALLVDLDLQEPSVHLLFGVMPEAGVGDCLAGRAPVSSALLALEVYPGLVLLPGKHSVAQSSELLGGQRARALFREIKGRYLNRVVIYDLPPMLTSDDALVFAPQADAVLVVIGENRTERADLIRSIELLRDVPVLGTVLNGVQATVDPTAAR